MNSDPEVLRFVPDASFTNIEQARKVLLAHAIADYRKYGFGRCACILKSTREQIGFAGLKYLEELGEVELGFRLMRAHWGFGLATEAAIALVRFGFRQSGAQEHYWPCDAGEHRFRASLGKSRIAPCWNGPLPGDRIR